MFGGTKAVGSVCGWVEPQQRETFHANRARNIAKRLLLSAFRVRNHVPVDAGALITFDDGPDPEVTPRVLDILAEHQVRAIFFVVGNRIPRAPHMLRKIVDAGHWLGNHTYSHPLEFIPSFPRYLREIRDCQKAIEQIAGVRPVWFRAPLGALTMGSLLGPQVAGLRSLLWSLDVGDWQLRCESDAVAAGEQLAGTAVPGDVVLLHDDNRHVLTVLRTALPQMKQRMSMDKALMRLAVN